MLLTARNLEKSYGPRLLFSGITLGLDDGQRVGLIGANGSGKSTLLRIFAGLEQPDVGEIVAKRNLRVGFVAQEEHFEPELPCWKVIHSALDPHLDDHERHLTSEQALDRAGFADPNALVGSLSGGWRKRLAIVRALVDDPQLVLMDEPTNHLDIDGILWLERAVQSGNFGSFIVSHDRRFLESVANRIIELGRAYPDGFLSHNGRYSDFVEKREEFLAAQRGREQSLASGVRREIEWLRRGAKARTTKAKGRIERAGEMMSELAELKTRNTAQTGAEVEFVSSDRKTKKLIELNHVSKQMGGRVLFSNLSLRLTPAMKLGLLGPNGSGKSTFIRLLSGQLEPDAGTIVRADALRIVVFDQHREQLDQNLTLRRALSPGGDSVLFQGQFQHISGWAQRFLFRSEQLDIPLRELSGGEQARVLIARLMLKEADVLILDEPTNDLDLLTLDVLESSLRDFAGALVLVTHDRYMLERLATDILALDGKGHAAMYAELAQWEEAQLAARRTPVAPAKPQAAPAPPMSAPPAAAARSSKRLKWNEQRELEGMEAAIAAAEARLADLQKRVQEPDVLRDHEKMRVVCSELDVAQREVERLYARWAELEALAG